MLASNDLNRPCALQRGLSFSANEAGLAFVENIQNSGLIAKEDLEKMAFRNAESLLGVKIRKN
jgi:hypothetical protein